MGARSLAWFWNVWVANERTHCAVSRLKRLSERGDWREINRLRVYVSHLESRESYSVSSGMYRPSTPRGSRHDPVLAASFGKVILILILLKYPMPDPNGGDWITNSQRKKIM